MKNRGFTLIEVIVTMAIISILAGIIVPISYRVWEASETSLTLERMATIKKAMLGDPDLYQQGLRAGYGFVGDNGELPASLDDLLTDQGTYPDWAGPYLGTNVDPRYFAEDAWGEPFIYTVTSDALGRRVAATLVSKGLDRVAGTSDDLDAVSAPTVQVSQSDVVPADMVEGNFSYVISVSEYDENPVYFATLNARYREGGSEVTMALADCIRIDVGLVQKLVPRSGTVGFTGSFPAGLPIGRAVISSRLFASSSCSGAPLATTDGSIVYISPGLNTVRINLPALYYHINNGP